MVALSPGKEMTGNSGMTSATKIFQWFADLNEVFHAARKDKAHLDSALMNCRKNIVYFTKLLHLWLASNQI